MRTASQCSIAPTYFFDGAICICIVRALICVNAIVIFLPLMIKLSFAGGDYGGSLS